MRVSKINEVHLKVETEPSIARELADYFTFEVPGHRFMPAYKNKIWDGKIRLFSTATGKIYVGLLKYVKKFCDRNDIQINIDEGVEDVKKITREVVEDLLNLLNPWPEVTQSNFVIIRLMQWNMVLSQIGLFLFLLLLRANH